MSDFDFINELSKFKKGFGFRESKDYVLKLYVDGRITRDEFIRRMNNAK